jgi:hypothetical protein
MAMRKQAPSKIGHVGAFTLWDGHDGFFSITTGDDPSASADSRLRLRAESLDDLIELLRSQAGRPSDDQE